MAHLAVLPATHGCVDTSALTQAGGRVGGSGYRASGLNLTIAAIILWNTLCLGHAVAELRAQGETLPDTLLGHIVPLGWEHISFNGDYVWPSEPLRKGSGKKRGVWGRVAKASRRTETRNLGYQRHVAQP